MATPTVVVAVKQMTVAFAAMADALGKVADAESKTVVLQTVKLAQDVCVTLTEMAAGKSIVHVPLYHVLVVWMNTDLQTFSVGTPVPERAPILSFLRAFSLCRTKAPVAPPRDLDPSSRQKLGELLSVWLDAAERFGPIRATLYLEGVTFEFTRKELLAAKTALGSDVLAMDSRLCHFCGVLALKRCGRCQKARYCSADCQRKAWPTHKTVCKG